MIVLYENAVRLLFIQKEYILQLHVNF